MVIDVDAAADELVTNASAKAEKLVSRYVARSGKLDAAKSPDAQKAYEEAMRDPAVLKRRQMNLAKLSEDDLNRGMREKGAASFAAGVRAGQEKWRENFTPYARAIDEVTSRLPPRTRDPMQNLNNRAGPLVKGLSDLKKKIG